MAKKTLQQRFTDYFLAKGYTQIDSKNRYKMFLAPFKDKNYVLHSRYIFLGNNGAVRVNVDSKNAATSRSYTEKFTLALQEWEASK